MTTKGTFKSFDPATGQITLSTKHGDRPPTDLAHRVPNPEFTLNGAPAAAADLQPGDDVTLETVSTTKVTAVRPVETTPTV